MTLSLLKQDKGSGVFVMDKQEYLRLLSEASVNDTNKFRAVPLERPKSKGRPPKYYHPLLEKEKHLCDRNGTALSLMEVELN